MWTIDRVRQQNNCDDVSINSECVRIFLVGENFFENETPDQSIEPRRKQNKKKCDVLD